MIKKKGQCFWGGSQTQEKNGFKPLSQGRDLSNNTIILCIFPLLGGLARGQERGVSPGGDDRRRGRRVLLRDALATVAVLLLLPSSDQAALVDALLSLVQDPRASRKRHWVRRLELVAEADPTRLLFSEAAAGLQRHRDRRDGADGRHNVADETVAALPGDPATGARAGRGRSHPSRDERLAAAAATEAEGVGNGDQQRRGRRPLSLSGCCGDCQISRPDPAATASPATTAATIPPVAFKQQQLVLNGDGDGGFVQALAAAQPRRVGRPASAAAGFPTSVSPLDPLVQTPLDDSSLTCATSASAAPKPRFFFFVNDSSAAFPSSSVRPRASGNPDLERLRN